MMRGYVDILSLSWRGFSIRSDEMNAPTLAQSPPSPYGLALVGFVFKNEIHKKDVAAIGLSLIALVPLFYLGVDWGRWLFIQFTMMAILFTSRINPMEQPFRTSLQKPSNKIFLIIGASHLCWHLPSFGMGIKLTSIFTKTIFEWMC